LEVETIPSFIIQHFFFLRLEYVFQNFGSEKKDAIEYVKNSILLSRGNVLEKRSARDWRKGTIS